MSQRSSRAAKWSVNTFLYIGGFLMAVPFLWMVLTSLKTSDEIIYGTSWLPSNPRWSNYSEALNVAPFLTYFRNTMVLVVGQTALTLIFSSMAGYALAKLPFRGSKLFEKYVVLMIMVPFQLVIISAFLVVKSIPFAGGNNVVGVGGIGWLNSWYGLIIPFAASPIYIFLARQFYSTLPNELIEAARIDGASEARIFTRIMTPLIKPALITIGVLQTEAAWNSFMWPLIITRDDSLRPLQLGLAVFTDVGGRSIRWEYLMAASTLATVPMLLLFVIAQKFFVQGIAGAGIKG